MILQIPIKDTSLAMNRLMIRLRKLEELLKLHLKPYHMGVSVFVGAPSLFIPFMATAGGNSSMCFRFWRAWGVRVCQIIAHHYESSPSLLFSPFEFENKNANLTL